MIKKFGWKYFRDKDWFAKLAAEDHVMAEILTQELREIELREIEN